MTNLYFQVASFFIMLLVIIVYFSKKRVKNSETRIFSILTIIGFIGIILDIAIVYIGYIDPVHSSLWPLSKFYFAYILLWTWLFSVYIFYISFSAKEKIYKFYKFYIIFTAILNIIGLIFIFSLPLYFFNENNVMYNYGPSVDILYSMSVVYVIVIILSVLVNFKNIINKKYVPVLALIIMALIALIVRGVNPGLLLTTTIITYINVIMFFTIENPDLKMINELNIAKMQAERANSAKTDFLSSMSHEIRTPLNAIVGFSQALLEEELPVPAKEEVKDIVMASDNLLEIVNGILDISKIEANKLEIVNTEYNINKVLKEIVSLIKGRLGDKPLEFRTNFDPTIPPYLYGDYVRLKQIIINLLTNSVKYTKEGFIEFKVSTVVKDDVCRLIISVEDSGIGIKPEKIDKLFTKFERFDVEKNITIEGTGLGLAITKKLVELMNGQIVVQSVYEEGSKFTVAIDQKIVKDPSKLLEEEKKKTEIINVDFTGKRILIVDDNKINLKVAVRLFQSYKVLIDEVQSGQECIDKIVNKEHFDLILLDDMMPKMSGIETLKELKKVEGFNIPVIAFTANAISGMKAKYLSEGFDDYLSKPLQKEELNEVLGKFLSN